MKAAVRGWFCEFVGPEVAQGYLGPVLAVETAAYHRLKRRLLILLCVLAIAVLSTTSAPVASRTTQPPRSDPIVVPSRTRFVLDESLGHRHGASQVVAPAEAGYSQGASLKLDAGFGGFSQILLAYELAD